MPWLLISGSVNASVLVTSIKKWRQNGIAWITQSWLPLIAKSTRFRFLEAGHECVRVLGGADAVDAVLSISDSGVIKTPVLKAVRIADFELENFQLDLLPASKPAKEPAK